MASLILAVLSVAAVVVIAVVWSGHRSAEAQRTHQARAIRAAARWTDVLINMNADNVEGQHGPAARRDRRRAQCRLRGGHRPYRDVVKTLRSQTTGQVESVSIEELHSNLDAEPEPPASTGPADAAAGCLVPHRHRAGRRDVGQ